MIRRVKCEFLHLGGIASAKRIAAGSLDLGENLEHQRTTRTNAYLLSSTALAIKQIDQIKCCSSINLERLLEEFLGFLCKSAYNDVLV